jgi:sec-independent protein translocase protein TatC
VTDRKLSIGAHLVELRNRVTWSVGAVLVTTLIAFAFHQQLLEFLMKPAQGFAGSPTGKPIYTELTEFIGIAMKVSFLGGLVLALPFVLYQAVMFVSPGLSGTEKRYLYTLLPFSLLAFAAGAAFGYRVLFPPAVNFLLSFGTEVATPYIRIGNYTNLMITLLMWMGVVFEMPIVAFFLSKIGVVTHRLLAKNRRYAIVVAFVAGAVITPTFDPVNQTLVAVPIIVMYELGIWLAWLGGRGRRKSAAAALTLDADRR